MTDARVAFVGLLRTMFSAESLRLFLRNLPDGTDIVDALPTPGMVGLIPYLEGAVDELIARQTDRRAIFDALRRVGDHRRTEIDEVEDIWHANPPSRRAPSPAGALAPTMRPPTADLVDRETEAEQLCAVLTSANATGLIRGLGGSGKTQLARLAVANAIDRFPGGALEINLAGSTASPVSSDEAIGQVLRAFEPGAKLPADQNEAELRYRAILAQRRVIIVADDASDATQVSALQPPSGGALIVTTRRRFTVEGVPPDHVVDLKPLPVESASDLVRRIAPRAADFADALADACGALPLAVRVAASVLAADDTLDVARYLDRLRDVRTSLAALRDPDNPQLDVNASLALSFEQLAPPLADVFAQLGVFTGSFDLPAAEAVIASEPPADRAEQLGRLRRHGLLEWDQNTQRYELHLLVRAFAASHVGDEPALVLRHARFYAQLATEAQRLWARPDRHAAGRSWYQREQPNIDKAWKWALSQPPSDTTDELILQFTQAAEGILDNAAYSLDVRRLLLQAALEAAKRRGSPAQLAFVATKLGLLYMASSTLLKVAGRSDEAIEDLQRSWRLLKMAGDDVAADFAGAVLGELASLYSASGQHDAAIEQLELWVTTAARTGDANGEAKASSLLVTEYASLTRLAEGAKALARAEQLLAASDKIGDLAMPIGNLGIAYFNSGDFDTAPDLLLRALDLAEKHDNRLVESAMLSLLARLDERAGRTALAAERLERHIALLDERGLKGLGERRALAQLLSSFAGDAPVHAWRDELRTTLYELADALGRLGALRGNLRDYDSAAAHFEYRRLLMERLDDRAGQASALFQLARVAKFAGKDAVALEYLD